VVVVGAGISGLSCAYRLKQLGSSALVLEANDRPGGSVVTTRRNGRVFEHGPQCPRFPMTVMQLIRELNLEGEFLRGDPRAKRYILKGGRLHEAPFSAPGLLSTPLVGRSSKFRILTEVFRHSWPPESEESLAEFIERKFGTEVLDYLVDPFVSTIFFGDSYRMGMESAFPILVSWERDRNSVVRGALRARKRQKAGNSKPSFATNGRVTDALPTLGSFRSGMGILPERLAQDLAPRIRYRASIACINRERGADDSSFNRWQIALRNGETIEAQHLVLAVPAFAAGALLARSTPELSSLLKGIEYATLHGASFVYQRSQVRHPLDGFGFMVPRREGLHTICTFWNSSLFPSRAREGEVLLTSYSRKLTDQLGSSVSDENWPARVAQENTRILGITGEPVECLCWENPTALPQYNVGHACRIGEITSALAAIPNLSMIGNFLSGRSIGDCVELGFAAAENVHTRLNGNHVEF
jgi:oxygen-dependent protoporphyrinogen oxidase